VNTGTACIRADWSGLYYTFDVRVFSPYADQGRGAVVDNRVTDPYSVSLSTGSTRSHLVDLTDPARPRVRTQLVVRAVASEVRVVTQERSNIEIGYDSRSQHTAARQVRRTQILPATAGAGTPPRLPASVRVDAGLGSAQHDTELTGDRDETRAYAKGDAVTVEVRLDFAASVITHRVGRDGDELRREAGLGRIATGSATITISASDLAELRTQLRSGRQDLLERLLDPQPRPRETLWSRFRHRLDPGATAR
jgi:tRNA threonylcarbamoyladenosine modification (KEOPS) complex  Pcc1 subunit